MKSNIFSCSFFMHYVLFAMLLELAPCSVLHAASAGSYELLLLDDEDDTEAQELSQYEGYLREFTGKSKDELNKLLVEYDTYQKGVPKIAALIKLGADPNATKEKGLTLLYTLTGSRFSSNKIKSAVFLLKHGALCNLLDNDGFIPLTQLAVHNGFDHSKIDAVIPMTYLLLSSGSETHWRVTNGFYTGMTASNIFRYHANKSVFVKKKAHKKELLALADFIDGYGLRSLQDRIIRSIILNTRKVDPHIAATAKKQIAFLQSPESGILYVYNTELLKQCFVELTNSATPKPPQSHFYNHHSFGILDPL